MKPTELLSKLAEVLSPEYQRRYEKATRDWAAGRNLEEAAVVLFPGTSQEDIARRIKLQEDELARRQRKGEKLVVEGLGTLTHDGEDFAIKMKTLVYPKSAIAVRVEPELAGDESVGRIWKEYCEREAAVVAELESAIAECYREYRQVPNMTGAPLPPLKRDADIWNTLGKPEITFCKRDNGVEMQMSWSPRWEEEHGLYVYLSSDLKIRHVGEFE